MIKKAISALLLVHATLYPVITTIDILKREDKVVYIFGDWHESSTDNNFHKKLFLKFIRRLNPRTTHCIVEDSFEQLKNEPYYKVRFSDLKYRSYIEKNFTFIEGLTEQIAAAGYKAKNIEFRQLPHGARENFIKYWETFFLPRFNDLKTIKSDNPLIQGWYKEKVASIFNQLPIVRRLLDATIMQCQLSGDIFDTITMCSQSYLLDVVAMDTIQHALSSHENVVVCVGAEHAYQIREALKLQEFIQLNSIYAERELQEHAKAMHKLSTLSTIEEYAGLIMQKNDVVLRMGKTLNSPYNFRRISEQLCALPMPLIHLPYTRVQFDAMREEAIVLEKQRARA